MTLGTTVGFSEWLRDVCDRQPELAQLLGVAEEEQHKRGYYHTLREILQQPASWIRTARQMTTLAADLGGCIEGIRNLILTGSGSSEYAGHCARLELQKRLGINARAIAGGVLLTNSESLSPGRPALLISIARSGDSPESAGALSLLLQKESGIRHLVLTCNASGGLATSFRGDPRVYVVALDDGTNDRSLVMTSSFTNLVLAAQFLGFLREPHRYQSRCDELGEIGARLLESHTGTLAHVASMPFNRAVYLGTGARFGAARESALKMLEMTAGRVAALAETYLGLRHGPMSYVHPHTLMVCFLSSEATARAYECDLLRELDQKKLGMMKVVVGERVPQEIVRDYDVALDCPGLGHAGDNAAAVIDAVVGQLLGLFRCLREGLRPDSPSESGVINRVVQGFTLHSHNGTDGDGTR